MSKETFFNVLRAMSVAIFVGFIMVAVIIVLGRDARETATERCADLGVRLGYKTESISGYCYITVRPGLKVRKDRVLDFLPVIDCGKE